MITGTLKNNRPVHRFFQNTFMNGFPKDFEVDSVGNTVDRKILLTRIKDFYGTKGTEKSFEFSSCFCNSVCEFYYPRNDILETSGGKWIEKKSIRVSSINGTSNFDMVGKTVFQNSQIILQLPLL